MLLHTCKFTLPFSLSLSLSPLLPASLALSSVFFPLPLSLFRSLFLSRAPFLSLSLSLCFSLFLSISPESVSLSVANKHTNGTYNAANSEEIKVVVVLQQVYHDFQQAECYAS